MPQDPTLLLFCGGMSGSGPEEMLAACLRENVVDLLDEALASGAFGEAVVVADADSAAALQDRLPSGARLDADVPGEAFHFGKRLQSVIDRNLIEKPVYVSCGLPLLKSDELAAVAHSLSASQTPLVITNNYYSADLVGFWPGDIVDRIELPNNDRILPRLLTQKLGLKNQSLPRTAANQFDLDSPADLLVLAVAGGAGPRVEAFLSTSGLDDSRLRAAAAYFTDDQAEILVAGRVGSRVWQYLETETACRVRMYSEERGMMAAGREQSGQVRSLLGFHLDAVGPAQFFQELGEMAQCAFLDTRPLSGHRRLSLSRADRFHSDLMNWSEIEDPWLRDFTLAAASAPIPVILGGNSLVASGLELLSEASWRRRDQEEAVYKAKGRAAR